MVAGEAPSIEEHRVVQGNGTEVDLDDIRAAADAVRDEMQAALKGPYAERYRLEASAAAILYESLQHIDADTAGDPRDDPGFWRYLSLAYFWDFIAWRESRAFAKGNFEKYVDGRTATECVLTRMYARGAAVGGLDHLRSSEAVQGTDFWRSHVLRVRTATAPPVVRAFVEMQKTRPLGRDDLREFAKALTRTWTNVVPAIYDDDDAGALISELREEMFPAGAE
jgi:hypothetical protein